MKPESTQEYLHYMNTIINNRQLRALYLLDVLQAFLGIVQTPVEVLEQMRVAWDSDTKFSDEELAEFNKKFKGKKPETYIKSISKKLGWLIDAKNQYLDAELKNWKLDEGGNAV